jgi:hypothetical protein
VGVSENRIIFLDPVPPSAVPMMMSGADVSVMLYQQSFTSNNSVNTPNKLFQSIMAQIPILATNNQTFNKILYHNDYGPIGETVNENDTLGISEKLLFLMDADRHSTYVSNARLLSQHISWDGEGNKLKNLYQTLFKH